VVDFTEGYLTVQYGANCMGHREFDEWVERLRWWRTVARSGRPSTVTYVEIRAQIDRSISVSGKTEESASIDVNLKWAPVMERKWENLWTVGRLHRHVKLLC